jgi:hypothetical protein
MSAFVGKADISDACSNVCLSPKADNLGVVRALKTGSREAWHIGFRCDVAFYLDRIVPTYASHLGRSCARNISPLLLYGG